MATCGLHGFFGGSGHRFSAVIQDSIGLTQKVSDFSVVKELGKFDLCGLGRVGQSTQKMCCLFIVWVGTWWPARHGGSLLNG